jgi:hypothetical protein
VIKEHERAVLVEDLSEHNLRAGDVGIVVGVYSDGHAYEIEFFTMDGRTLDVVTVEVSQVRPVNSREIMHARPLG